MGAEQRGGQRAGLLLFMGPRLGTELVTPVFSRFATDRIAALPGLAASLSLVSASASIMRSARPPPVW